MRSTAEGEHRTGEDAGAKPVPLTLMEATKPMSKG